MLKRGLWVLGSMIAVGVVASNIPDAPIERVKVLMEGENNTDTPRPEPAALPTVMAGAAVASEEPIRDEVGMVKNAMPQDGTTTSTLGKAFEGTFQSPKWSFSKNEKGVGVVQFQGTVQAGALDRAGFSWWPDTLGPGTEVARRAAALIAECGGSPSNVTPNVRRCLDSRAADLEIPVKFHFKVTADGRGFEVGDIDSTPWGWRTVREQPDRVFRFIYN